MIIRDKHNNPIILEEGMLPGYTGPVITGARSFNCINDSFELFVQEFRSSLYSFRFNWFKFYKNETLTCFLKGEGLRGRVVMESKIQHSLSQENNPIIEQDHGMLFWAKEAECSALYDYGKIYSTFDVYSSKGLTEQLAYFFPELKEALHSNEFRWLTEKPCYVTPSMKDVIRQMIIHPYDATTSQFYFDIKVKEFLFVFLQNSIRTKKEILNLSSYERNRIVEAKRMLLDDLSKKPITISELSKLSGINPFKLKIGFRQLFGMGIFECLQEKRMEQAKDMILNSAKPIKEISALSGYPRTTNFITAFRRHFGYTPGSLRRK